MGLEVDAGQCWCGLKINGRAIGFSVKRFSFFFFLSVSLFLSFKRSSPGINALRACVYIYIRQLSSFRAPTLWFIDLTVATFHIQYTEFMPMIFF